MHVLVLTKRQYMSKDLLDDGYGRFAEIPLGLAERSHEVDGLCLSYRKRAKDRAVMSRGGASVTWTSVDLSAIAPAGFSRYYLAAARRVAERRPDVIWACSDAFHVILGAALSRRTGVPCVADLYDNFEAYAGTRIPGVAALYRRALRHVSGITCISDPLRERLQDVHHVEAPVAVLPNAANDTLFRPHDRAACRGALDLPPDVPIVGTAGAISPSRGIATLFDAFERLVALRPSAHLLLAGPRDAGTALPAHPNVRYLGAVAHDRVPLIYGAMDAAVICNEPSPFGDYCFPQKYYEILACGTPVVVARVGALAALPGKPVNAFYDAGDPRSLAESLARCLDDPGELDVPVATWRDRARELEAVLLIAAARA